MVRAYRGGKRSAGKATIKTKTTIKPSGENLAKIAKQIKTLQRADRQGRAHVWCRLPYNGVLLQTNYNAFPLTDYFAMVNNPGNLVFQSSYEECKTNKVQHKSISTQCFVSLYNDSGLGASEGSSVSFSCFLVSLKDEGANRVNYSTGALTLTGGTDYTTIGSIGGVDGAMTYLNPKLFNIHKKKFFTLSNFTTAPGATGQAYDPNLKREWRWNIAPNKVITSTTTPYWSDLPCGIDPSKTYYILIFNNNSAVDNEWPIARIQTLHHLVPL